MNVSRLYVVAFFVLFATFFAGCNDEKKQEPVAERQIAEKALPINSLFKAKVQSVVGSCNLQRQGSEKWNALRVSQHVVENDRIKTEQESESVLQMQDGSAITVAENTNLLLNAEEIGKNMDLTVLVENGIVHFDVQKQVDTKIKFKSGNATASIRGTAGFVGNVNGKLVASLKEGKVEVESGAGQTEAIVENQTVVVDSRGIAKVNLKSSGSVALAKALGKALSDTAISVPLALETFDKAYEARVQELKNSIQLKVAELPDTVYLPSVTLQGRITKGVAVTVWGYTDTVPENGMYERKLEWDANAYGPKRFLAICSDGDVEYICHSWKTVYANPNADGAIEADTAADSTVQKVQDKNLMLSVKINGKRNERIHIGPEVSEYSGNLNFSLAGISANDLDELKNIVVKRAGKVIQTFSANELTSLNYEIPIKVQRNKIANFEVAATLKNGKVFKALKTYEVFCLLANHPGGKARNSLMNETDEYNRLKNEGGITAE